MSRGRNEIMKKNTYRVDVRSDYYHDDYIIRAANFAKAEAAALVKFRAEGNEVNGKPAHVQHMELLATGKDILEA